MQLQRGSRCHLFLAPTQLDELARKLATGDFGRVCPLKQKQLLSEKMGYILLEMSTIADVIL